MVTETKLSGVIGFTTNCRRWNKDTRSQMKNAKKGKIYSMWKKKNISMNRCSITQHDHRDGKKEETRRKTEIVNESESEIVRECE